MVIFEALKNLMRRVPGKAWLAVGGLLVGALWLQQHDARIRQQARLQQLQNQASARMASLRKQAEQDVKQANVENAKAIAELDQRRQQLEKQNQQLSAQLTGLRWQAHIQAGEVATLPISQIVTRVATQLGLNSGDVLSAPSSADTAKAAASASAASAESAPHETRTERLCDLCGPKALTQRAQRPSVSSVLNLFNPQRAQRMRKEQITNYKLQDPAVEAGQIADMAKSATSAPPEKEPGSSDAAMGNITRKNLNAGILRSAQDDEQRAQDDRNAALALTSSGARKVETALVALNACRSESTIETQQISNCQARAEAAEAEVKRLQSSVASLNQALQAKDKILAQQQSESRAELRAARGTFLGRLAHTAEHVAIGVVIGMAIGVAVK